MTRLYHTEIRDPDKNTLTSVPTPIVAMSTTEGRQGPGVQQDGRDARSSRELLVVGAMQLFFSLVTLLGLDPKMEASPLVVRPEMGGDTGKLNVGDARRRLPNFQGT